MRAKLTGRFCALLSAAALAATTQSATAGLMTLSTYNITNNGNPDVGSQLKILVTDQSVDLHNIYSSVYADLAANEIAGPGANQVNFIFLNLGATASSIADVYFDDGTLLGISSVIGSDGVDFSVGASPGNLPGGNAVDFNTTAGFFSADSNPPAQPNGVNPGEWLLVTFNLINGQDYDDVVAALNLGMGQDHDIVGALRIGMHVQGIGAPGGSDGYVSNQEVPEPASMTLAALGGLGAVVLGRRRRKQAA